MRTKPTARKVTKSTSKTKNISRSRKSKTVVDYLRIYFISLFAGLATFIVGNYLFIPHAACANENTCTTDLSVHIDNSAVGFFEGHKVIPPRIDLALDNLYPKVLGANVPAEEKHMYVDLSTQKLYAYQGTTQIMQTFIASGKWNPTPVGNFNIWEKLRSTRMAGGEGASAYDLPNVPYVMYFYQDYGIHGAYWHNNFGHAMSHGCVNMRIVDAETIYNWADGPTTDHLGTAVSVCNTFSPPNSCIQNQPIQ